MPKQSGVSSESSTEEIEMDSKLEVEDNSVEDNEADSSSAEDSTSSEDIEHKSLLDVVQDAVKKEETDKTDEDGETPDEEDEDSDDNQDEVEDSKGKDKGKKSKEDASSASDSNKEDDGSVDGFTEEELAKEKPSTQKRIRNLLAKLEETSRQTEDLSPRAERFDQIDGFMTKHTISPEEAAEAFSIMALVKTNPQEALKRLQGHVDNVSTLVGEKLPADLVAKVEEGYIDEETARELSRARAQVTLSQQREQSASEQARNISQANEKAQRETHMAQTLDNWQSTKETSDPDYAQKHDLVRTNLQALMQMHGAPKTAQQVVQYAEAAYENANQVVGRFMPKQQKQEKRSISSRAKSGPPPRQNIAPDASIYDVAKAALNK